MKTTKKQRDEAASVLGLSKHYERFLHRIPVATETIHHTEVKAWREKHAHPEREYRGAIGGGFSMLSAESSLGTIRHLQCCICRHEAFIDDDH